MSTTQPHPLVAALARRRVQLGLTQATVARRMHLTRPQISMLEAGKRRPALDQITAYAAAVGLRVVLAEPRTENR